MEYANSLDVLEIEALPSWDKPSLFMGLSAIALIVFATLACLVVLLDAWIV